MAKYRHCLPQGNGKLFMTDGGIETTLVFHRGLDLPHFAAFVLLADEAGTSELRDYFRTYAGVARTHGVGLVLESATWRASPDWGALLGYDDAALAEANRKAIALLEEIRADFETPESPMPISGCVGPRGDGYAPDSYMTAEEAEHYHRPQIEAFRDAGADLVTAITMTYAEEAIGITRAARAAGMPVVISFTTETDGRLPSGETLGEAIERVDRATGFAPEYFMINCAHPSHFEDALAAGEEWTTRIRGLRANASTMSHAELDEAEELDDGDPQDLGERYRRLRDAFGDIGVLGGCCGTDHRHVDAMVRECKAARADVAA